jgi:hypothetical protein
MSDYLIDKEMAEVLSERQSSQVQINTSKEIMAKRLRKQMGDNPTSLSMPIKKKKPFKVRYNEFVNKVKILLGFKNEI